MPSFHSTLKFLGWKHEAIQSFFFFTGRDEVPLLHPLLQTRFPSSLFPSSASGEKRRSSRFHIRLICTKWNSPAVYLKHQSIPHLSVFFKQTHPLLPCPGEKKHWPLNRSEWMSRKSSWISNSESELKSTHLSIIQKRPANNRQEKQLKSWSNLNQKGQPGKHLASRYVLSKVRSISSMKSPLPLIPVCSKVPAPKPEASHCKT